MRIIVAICLALSLLAGCTSNEDPFEKRLVLMFLLLSATQSSSSTPASTFTFSITNNSGGTRDYTFVTNSNGSCDTSVFTSFTDFLANGATISAEYPAGNYCPFACPAGSTTGCTTYPSSAYGFTIGTGGTTVTCTETSTSNMNCSI